MKPAAFDYVAPGTVDEAVAALAEAGEQASILAGGQSLILEMHYRRARPDLVVDINRVRGLDRLRVDGGALHAGALVRHEAFEAFESPRVAPGPLGRLLSLVVVNIAHPPIRALGTMAGSLAWAHPAAEWCAVAVALDAGIELRGPGGTRVVGARDYFHGPHRTARLPQEMITAVRLPLLDDVTGVAFAEHRRTHASFAQLAAVVTLTVLDGVITEARVGLANAADRPVRAHAAERSLVGSSPLDDDLFGRAGRIAAERDAAPIARPYADVEYQRQVIAVLVGRALRQAYADHGGARR
ncbi:FAD binding domain-containing protein [Streptosporangium sp. NBC_01469]|uniref:FAD binding domain-containing protein n=1 Tax=Streptosporangium sp. NBC_01469 TaxID=2903898 RepID=UPI002E2E35CF|nr:FAD binding domain-containing protein [Streptosporangium sp. NBC_01469]